MAISAYRNDTSGIYPSSISAGWNDSGQAVASCTGSFDVGSNLTVSGAANLNGGATVKNHDFTVSGVDAYFTGDVSVSGQLNASGDVVCSSSAAFRGSGTVNFVHDDPVIDINSNPSSDQQRWPIAINDKNGNAMAYCKFIKGTNGNKQWAFVVAHPKSSGSGNNLAGLIVNCDASGKYSTTAVNADSDSNSTDIATTFWVRRYIWDDSESQLVHTVNDETISGSKTFTYAIRGGATTLIQSVPWEGISIADSSRESTVNRMMAVILDKDGKRFAGIEASADSNGQRYVHITMRRRDDSGWVSPFKAVELPDGTTYCEGSHHPPAGDNSYKLATTGWVLSHPADRSSAA